MPLHRTQQACPRQERDLHSLVLSPASKPRTIEAGSRRPAGTCPNPAASLPALAHQRENDAHAPGQQACPRQERDLRSLVLAPTSKPQTVEAGTRRPAGRCPNPAASLPALAHQRENDALAPNPESVSTARTRPPFARSCPYLEASDRRGRHSPSRRKVSESGGTPTPPSSPPFSSHAISSLIYLTPLAYAGCW